MGRKLAAHLERAGFAVVMARTLPDLELSFDGPALPEVVEAWAARLDRMKLLQEQLGVEFEAARDELLQCLQREDHRSLARVVCCLAR